MKHFIQEARTLTVGDENRDAILAACELIEGESLDVGRDELLVMQDVAVRYGEQTSTYANAEFETWFLSLSEWLAAGQPEREAQ